MAIKAITFDLWDTIVDDDSDEVVRAARGLRSKRDERRHLLWHAVNDADKVALEDVDLIMITRGKPASHQIAVTLRRHLSEAVSKALVETQRSRRKIDDTMRNEPIKFEDLSARVYGLGPRIDGMKLRVDGALGEQRAFLQSVALGELQAQKQRLDIYTVQARFALAAIYDLAATVGDASE